MDEEKNKDVKEVAKTTEQKVEKNKKKVEETVVDNNIGQQTIPENSGNKTKIIIISVVAVILSILLIVGIVAIAKNAGKPSKKQAEKIVESYLEAINDEDEDALLSQIDVDGYVILKEEKEKKFDKKYKDKSSYINKYMDKNNVDDIEEIEDDVIKNEGYVFSSYYDYSFKELSSVKKSSKSGKISVIKAKIKQESSYSKDTKTLTLYVIKSSGKYKVVGSKLS